MNTVSKALTGLAATAAATYAGYAAWTYARYGRTTRPNGHADPLLDRFIPDYEAHDRHSVIVRAPMAVTFSAARNMDLHDSPVARAILAVRTLPSLLKDGAQEPEPRGLLYETLALGWGILADTPEEIVVGAVTKPWEPIVTFHAVPPQDFARFSEPGFAKIAWTLAVEPIDEATCRFVSETRVATTDAASREKFRRYWALMSPGIRLIRMEAGRLVKREAERMAHEPLVAHA